MIAIFKPHQAIENIKPYLPENPVIIEAGAFNGNDTQKLAAAWPRGIIHAFEPVPELFEQLKKNTAHLPNVICYPLALSDHDGTATFHVAEKPHKPNIPTQAGSLHKPKERLAVSPIIFPRTTTVQTITLDSWAQHYNIKQVDFLWLDTQGHELAIIQAAPHTRELVTAVYAEVGFIEAYEQQQTYLSVKSWFEAHGFYEAGRDFQNEEQWFFGNVLFVKRNA
jgi:FkbM family methyltransferase